ncbi:MAG: IclR family transcriptional regulator, partial [Anaerolineae bacterium]|nr:IclR family transcriptional regulator [Anaerolineae bacterium]
AYRLVANLLHCRYLTETETGYWLSLKMLRFGTLVEESLDLKQEAEPYLHRLRNTVNETVHLAVLDSDMRVVYLEKLATRHAVGLMMSRIGLTAPMHCTALGKAMAAFRPEEEIRAWVRQHGLPPYTPATITDPERFFQALAGVRARGYAVDMEEFEAGVRCVAAPIRDRAGHVVAAVSVSAPANRMPMPLVGSDLAHKVVETALHISEALGYVAE